MRFSIDSPKPITIGRLLDNETNEVIIDCGAWFVEYPQLKHYRIEVEPPEGDPYVAPEVVMQGAELVWTITSSDTATVGAGRYQVVALGDDGERKTSKPTKLVVKEIIEGSENGEPPEPQQQWYDKLLTEINEVLEIVEGSKASIDAANEAVSSALLRRYGNTPFYTINKDVMPLTEKRLAYKSDGSTDEIENCSAIMRCPKILGINVYGDTILYVYIGDMVDGEFVLDKNYIFRTSSKGYYNYMNAGASQVAETDGSKYFYYKVVVDGDYDLLFGDEFPDCGFEANAIVPFYSTNAGAFASSSTYSSLVLPSGCYYAVIPGANVTADQRSRIHVSYHTEGTNTLTVIPGGISFGHIPDDAGAALLRFPDGVSPDDLRVYVSKPVLSNANNARASVIKQAAIDLAKKFSFVSQKTIAWDDSQRSMAQGKQFYGVPYSSRWKNSHHVGFEVSCETALNALADEYSIAYDGGKYYESGVAKFYDAVSGHSEINQGGDTVPSGGGPGYGLVCSSFMCLINGNAYPQTNRGFTFDKGFEVQKRTDLNSGMWLSNEALSHCVFVDEIFDKGYSLYHGIQPCIGKTVQTSEIDSNAAITTDTRLWRLNGYSYSVANRHKTDVNQQLMKLDVAVAGGNIRPWRGNKAVYGPWDKSANGSGIGITIHNGAATARLTTPSGTVHSLSVSGKVYLDISSYVTEDGTYTLDSGAGTTAEYFRYFNHDDVTLTFDADGRAVLTPDAEYVYAKVTGYGAGYESAGTGSGPIVIAAGQAYPDLAADPDRIEEVYAAIVADPTVTGCWGRYSCMCSIGTWEQPSNGTGGSYTLPTASETVKGGVKIGEGLEMDGEVLKVKTEDAYVLIETITLSEDLVLSRSQEPDGTPYRFKAVAIKGHATGTQAESCRINYYFANTNLGSGYCGAITATGNRYKLEILEPSHGYWQIVWCDWTTNASAAMFNRGLNASALVNSIEDCPYVTRIATNKALGAGTTIEIWGVRA